MQSRLEKIIEDKNATIGIAIKLAGEEAFAINNDVRYPTMSVYKFHLALAVLDSLDRANLPLDIKIKVKKGNIVKNTYSPMRKVYPKGGKIKISELLHYSVSLSDNNACDILFRWVGGTNVVDNYIRSLGIKEFAITATEEEMHQNLENQYLNWTTPLAAVELMDLFLNRDLFSPVYKEFLYNLLIGTRTGMDKLKAGLPTGIVLGHKTGSSFRSEEGLKFADNDLGFVQLPDGRFYSIAVFIQDSFEDDETNAAIIAEISRNVYEIYEEGLKDVYLTVDQWPEFPWGNKELIRFINQETKMFQSGCHQITGRVIVGFVVERDGSLAHIKVLKSVEKHLDQKAIEIVQSMPLFVPGFYNDEPVRTWYMIPVTYKVF